MVRRAHEQQDRRIEPDVGVLSCASASRGADRSAAQVRWRAEMCCDGYPGAVVLTAPSNKRLKLAGALVLKEAVVSCPAGHGLTSTTLAPAGESPAVYARSARRTNSH